MKKKKATPRQFRVGDVVLVTTNATHPLNGAIRRIRRIEQGEADVGFDGAAAWCPMSLLSLSTETPQNAGCSS
jgi:hypothetical protein